MIYGNIRQGTTSSSEFSKLSPPGPDADLGRRWCLNTEQAHPMTLQRCDTEPSASGSQHFKRATQSGNKRKGENSKEKKN